MRRREIEGWLFDAYPDRGGMRIWIITRDGLPMSALDPWSPAFHVRGTSTNLRRALSMLEKKPFPVVVHKTERTELFSGESLPVLELRLPPLRRDHVAAELENLGLELYGSDIHLAQLYHYDRGHFPTAKCAFEIAPDAHASPEGVRHRGPAGLDPVPHDASRVLSWELQDDTEELDYELPPTRALHLTLAGSETAGEVDPNHAPRGALTVTRDGVVCELEGPPEEQLDSLIRHISEWDPDIITTDHGDGYLLPMLDALGRRLGREIPFSRDPGREMAGKGPRSFYTYGRAVYQNGARTLFGRWHLDLKNSFLLRAAGLDGLIEIARVARIPVQRAARTTIGTALTSMQLNSAWRDGILTPVRKQQAEDFRTADELLAADKGGLIYRPEPAWHDGAVEYDFAAMYPTLMVRWNVSPETVNCPCCPDNKVPEIGHHLCLRRRGLVPKVLAPILKKRAEYKRRARLGGERAASYKARATAQKWVLVCCFGYLGFKNARFGKIESHECVTALGREALLKAKDAVEARGCRMLHALVDSLWLAHAPGMDVEGLRRAIEEASGSPVAVEGIYRWVRFCPSREDPLEGVPNRYFGAFINGELKLRGIALRRRDTPRLVKDAQRDLLEVLAGKGTESAAGRRELLGRLDEIAESYRARLRDGKVTAAELAITVHLSRTPDPGILPGQGLPPARATLSGLAAGMLAAAGLRLTPGETVRYVIASARDPVREWRVVPLAMLEGPLDYDQRKYLELLERGVREIVEGI